MTARTHDAFAFASLVTIASFYPPDSLNLLTLVGAVIASDIGALIPDMDTGANRLWQMLPAGEKVGRMLKKIFYKHRTVTHSILGTYLIYRFFEFLLPVMLNKAYIDSQSILISLMIGYVSHLISDSLTEEGLPLLFPLKISFGIPPIKKIRIKTGKWFENFVIYPGIWVYLAFFIHAKKEVLIGVLKLVSN